MLASVSGDPRKGKNEPSAAVRESDGRAVPGTRRRAQEATSLAVRDCLRRRGLGLCVLFPLDTDSHSGMQSHVQV